MKQGKGGGIGLLPEFVLHKTVLSNEEKTEILSALQGFHAAHSISADSALLKLRSLFQSSTEKNWVEIDFSSWSATSKEQFELIKQAILKHQVIRFNYNNSDCISITRMAEPITLWFKEKSWYLKAYCRSKQDFRTFKLSRMKHIEFTQEHFIERIDYSFPEEPRDSTPYVTIVAEIDSSQSYRVYDDFDESDFIINQDGSFTVTMSFAENEWVYGYLLSYGHYAKVLEPPRIRELLKDRLRKSMENYALN